MYFSCCVEQGYSQQGKLVGKSGQGQATGKFLQHLESILTCSQQLSSWVFCTGLCKSSKLLYATEWPALKVNNQRSESGDRQQGTVTPTSGCWSGWCVTGSKAVFFGIIDILQRVSPIPAGHPRGTPRPGWRWGGSECPRPLSPALTDADTGWHNIHPQPPRFPWGGTKHGALPIKILLGLQRGAKHGWSEASESCCSQLRRGVSFPRAPRALGAYL